MTMLAHSRVPRACPVLSPSEMRALAARAEGRSLSRGKRPVLSGKAALWRRLLESAYVLHCFPPGGDPLPGEKRFVFMGHPKHTHAEIAFARRQGLWRVDEGSSEGRCVP